MPIIVFCNKEIAYEVTQKDLDRFKKLESIADKQPNQFYGSELAAEMGDLIKKIESRKPIILDHLVTGDFA